MLYLPTQGFEPSIEYCSFGFGISFEAVFEKRDGRFSELPSLFLTVRSAMSCSWHVKFDSRDTLWEETIITFSLREVRICSSLINIA